jgi:membrane protein
MAKQLQKKGLPQTLAVKPREGTATDADGLKGLDARLSEHLRHVGHEFIDDLKATYRWARANELSMLASSISFYCIFAMFPILILCFIGARYLIGNESQSTQELIHFFETVVPTVTPWISSNLILVLQRNALSNVMGLIVLSWSTYELFICLHSAFAKISVRGEQRDFIGSNFICLLCFSAVALSTTVVMILYTTKAPILRSFFGDFGNRLSLSTVSFLALLAAIACVIASLTFIYKFMPIQQVRLSFAFRGSLLFLLLFLAGRVGYQAYVQFNQHRGEQLYGVFSILIFVIIWIYYLSSAFMFSAQYVIYLEEKHKRK